MHSFVPHFFFWGGGGLGLASILCGTFELVLVASSVLSEVVSPTRSTYLGHISAACTHTHTLFIFGTDMYFLSCTVAFFVHLTVAT